MVPYEFTNEMKTLYTVCPMYRFLNKYSYFSTQSHSVALLLSHPSFYFENPAFNPFFVSTSKRNLGLTFLILLLMLSVC